MSPFEFENENIEKAAAALIIGGAVTAGIGALSGLMGASIFHSSCPDWADITTSEFVNSMIVGELILLPVMYAVSRTSKTGLFTHAIFGSVAGMLGGKVLGHLDSASDVGFAAAAGATGASLLSIIGLGLECVKDCISQSNAGQPLSNDSGDHDSSFSDNDLEQQSTQRSPLLHAFRKSDIVNDRLEEPRAPLPNRSNYQSLNG